MGRKQKWEKEFEAYDAAAENKKIDELSKKFESKTLKREENEELKKSMALRNNIKKVENIIEFKNHLELQRTIINKQIEFENLKNGQMQKGIETNKELEKELEEIQNKLDEVNGKLKAKNLSEEEKTKLSEEKTKLIAKRNINNQKFASNQQLLDVVKGKDEKVDLKKLEEEKNEIGIKISKCCFAGKLLMAGKSWEYIYAKSGEGKKYTSKDGKLTEKYSSKSEKIPEKQDSKSKQEELKEDELLEQVGKELGKNVKEINEEPKELAKQSEFQRKHPKLAKFVASFRNIFSRKNKKKETEKENRNEEKTEKEETKSERDEFLDYLKDISEKGMNEKFYEDAKEKLAQNKKKAYERESTKFGKDYAEMSYHEDENEKDI